jgi:hypothetical protein
MPLVHCPYRFCEHNDDGYCKAEKVRLVLVGRHGDKALDCLDFEYDDKDYNNKEDE